MSNLFPTGRNFFFPQFFDQTFDSFFTPMNQPSVDIEEKEDSYIINMDIPGMSKEDINVTYNNNLLTVDASQNQETENKDEATNYIRRERVMLPISSRTRAPCDALGRRARVLTFARRIVVGDGDVDARAFWQGERRRVEVRVLPAEVPVADPQQALGRAVGQRGGHLHLLGEVVRRGRARRTPPRPTGSTNESLMVYAPDRRECRCPSQSRTAAAPEPTAAIGRPLFREVDRQPALLVLRPCRTDGDAAGRRRSVRREAAARCRRERIAASCPGPSRRFRRRRDRRPRPGRRRAAPAAQSPQQAPAKAGQHLVGANAAGVDRRTRRKNSAWWTTLRALGSKSTAVIHWSSGKIQRQDDVAIEIGTVRRHVERSGEPTRHPAGRAPTLREKPEAAAPSPDPRRACRRRPTPGSVARSASDRRRSSRNSSKPGAAVACHGGMYRRAVTLTINSPRFFTSSYESSGNGADWPGR